MEVSKSLFTVSFPFEEVHLKTSAHKTPIHLFKSLDPKKIKVLFYMIKKGNDCINRGTLKTLFKEKHLNRPSNLSKTPPFFFRSTTDRFYFISPTTILLFFLVS